VKSADKKSAKICAVLFPIKSSAS